MRRLSIASIVLLGLLVIVAWKSIPVTEAGGTPATGVVAINNATVAGSYSVLFTLHDTETDQQDGAGAGALALDGSGNLGGAITVESRCTGISCGYAVAIRAAVSGKYAIYPDGSATLTMCLTITNAVTTQGGSPSSVSQTVQVIWEGSFASETRFGFSFGPPKLVGRFIQTLIGACGSLPSSMVQSPNNTIATLEAL